METVNQWKDIIYNTFRDMGTKMAEVLPNLIGAILVLLLGWIITKITIYILKRVFKLAKVDNLPTFATFKNGVLVNQSQTTKTEVLTELVNEVL